MEEKLRSSWRLNCNNNTEQMEYKLGENQERKLLIANNKKA